MQNEINAQSISAKKAESQRPFHGNSILNDEALRAMHKERADSVIEDITSLQEKLVPISPFLEIGAGSVQRAAALLNNFDTDGVATDISSRSLQDAPYMLQLLGYEGMPWRISCDVHHLPFLPNTFQFAFAYQALHHFENPVPVLKEMHRVLGKGGHLFFSEEPMDSGIRRFLRGDRVLSHPPTAMQGLGYRLGVEKLFWDDGAHERALGMTEARFDIDLWRLSLEPFEIIDMEINRKIGIHTNLQKPLLNTLFASAIGGNVKGLCKKNDGELVEGDFRNRLMCLDCGSDQFMAQSSAYTCQNCARVYPVTEQILRMLPRELEAELYGEVAPA